MKTSFPIHLVVTIAVLFAVRSTFAQTTWGGNPTFEGNVAIGTSATNGNLIITGSTGSTASPGLKVTGDGGVLFTGSDGIGQIPATGAGTRFMWYPKKGALRAGQVTGTNWNDSFIGAYSTAFGRDSYASAVETFAIIGGIATGDRSASIGGASSGANSVSLWGNAEGNLSVSMSGGESAGSRSFSFGSYAGALANNSIAIGPNSYVTGTGGVGLGQQALSQGTLSLAACRGNAYGDYSVSIGYNTCSFSGYSMAVGRYNVASGDPHSWTGTDPLFVIGNGNGTSGDPNYYHNALTVYQNGDMEMTGKVKMPRQGDIPMGEFGTP